ncbi:MAG: GDSL-type esterase/lipase family protein [Bacteroidales bacterium]
MRSKKYRYLFLLLFALSMNDCVKGENKEIAPETKEAVPLKEEVAEKIVIEPKYSFVKESLNHIHDKNGTLDSIFEIFSLLKVNPDSLKSPLSIVHIGDSHIQAGFLTGAVMRNMQKQFGNAGRGLVVPLRLAKTNAPRDYQISSDNTWIGGRLIQRKNTLPIGVGGIALATENSKIDFTLKLRQKEQDDYGFNKITIFSDSVSPKLSAGRQNFSMLDPLKEYPFAYALELKELTDSVRLKANSGSNGKSTFYGFSLENGKPGVLYHSIGINGAHYLDYQKEGVLNQIQALKPNLIILSMGTNEAFGRNFNNAEFRNQIDGVVKRVKAANPEAVLLLTTPAECYVKRRVNNKTVYSPNTKVARVRSVLVDYAKANGIAYWDLFELTGGTGSSKSWYANKLMAKDRIHFTETGYQLQGELLFNAFITEYNEYLSKRTGSDKTIRSADL